MQIYLDLIRTDLIMMNGAKNNLRPIIILMLALGILGGIFLDPMATFMFMFIVSAMFVPMIFEVQSKNNCERLYSLLPVTRKQLVTSRFLFVTAVYLALSIVMFAVLKISFAAGIYQNIGFYDEFFKKLGTGLSYPEICNILFFLVFALGAALVGASLKSWFRDSDRVTMLNGSFRKMRPKEIIITLLFVVSYFVIILFFSGAIPLNAAALVVLQLIIQLVTVADGVMFCVLMTALAGFSVMYSYVCTVLEYDDKDM